MRKMPGMRRSALVLAALLAAVPAARAEDLLQLYRLAVAGNPALKARELQIDAARARKDQARSRLLPQLSANANYSRNDFRAEDRSGDYYSSRRQVIQARQPLLDLASLYGTRAEKARVRQSEEEFAAARMEIAGELVDRYLGVLAAEDQLAYLAAEKDAAARQHDRLQHLFARQMAKVTDVAEVRAYIADLDAQEIGLRNARDVALERLREISGVAVAEVAPLARGNFPAPPGKMEDWVARGMGSNRELLALSRAIEVEEAGVAGARSQHAPQLALVASKSWSDAGYDNRRNPPYEVDSVGLQVTVPILEGGRVNALVREAEARRGIARQQYEQRRREIEREIRAAYLQTAADRARVDATAEAVRARETAVEAQARGVELGTAMVVDLLDARRRLYRARTDHAKARLDLVSSLTALKIRSGELEEGDMEEMNAWFSRRPGS